MVKDVHEILMECNDAGDEFKRMFIIYSMSIFLAPSSNKSLDLKLVKAVDHVTRISQFDWCEYVFEEMVRSVRVFKEGAKSTVSGCTPEIFLTQASDHEAEVETKEGYMMVKLPSGFETDEQIRARAMDRAHEIYLRMKRDNELFIGRYVHNMRKLITMKAKSSMGEATTSTQSGAKVDGAEDVNPKEHAAAEEEVENPENSTTETQTLPFMKDVGYHNLMDMLIARSYELKKAKQGLPSFDVWTEMLKVQYKELNKKYDGCTDKDLQNSDDDLACDDKQQDDDINDVTNLDSGDDEDQDDGLDNDMNSKLNDVISNIGVGVGSAVAREFNEELNRDTLNQEAVEKECEKINEETNVLTQLDEGVINVGLGGTNTVEEVNTDKPNKSIEKEVEEINEEAGKRDEETANVENLTNVEKGIGEDVEKTVNNVPNGEELNTKNSGKEGSGKNDGENNDDKSVGTHMKEGVPNVQLETAGTRSINDYLLHADNMNKIPKSADIVPHNLGCTMDCGLPDKDAQLVSDSMFRQDNLFETVFKHRKEVMDYCFLTDHAIKKTEIVCDFGIYHSIPKSDIESLLPDTKIEAVVIEAWAILLNQFQMAQKDSNRPTRIFYGLAHSGAMEKILLVDEEDVDELTRLKEDVWRTWDMWSNQYKQPLNLNSDMVFIPLLYQDH
ncbi:uncharacterized protein LOC141640147 [Silene latifolia]|uniref:uncharacterized protein LOC141640147 n=1 Tax=Silene latifolia TaxID=37657 RepID=UPI003D76E5E7